jgi:hypothetical protein
MPSPRPAPRRPLCAARRTSAPASAARSTASTPRGSPARPKPPSPETTAGSCPRRAGPVRKWTRRRLRGPGPAAPFWRARSPPSSPARNALSCHPPERREERRGKTAARCRHGANSGEHDDDRSLVLFARGAPSPPSHGRTEAWKADAPRNEPPIGPVGPKLAVRQPFRRSPRGFHDRIARVAALSVTHLGIVLASAEAKHGAAATRLRCNA